MIEDESSRNISINDTKPSLNDSRNEVNELIERYEKINLDYPEECEEY
jgi:archaellum component FlaC